MNAPNIYGTVMWPISVRHAHMSHLILTAALRRRNYLHFTKLKIGLKKFLDEKKIW